MAPLAAISLLAAAAAVAINPVLINVQFTGRRKKRSNEDQTWDPKMQEKMHELEVSFHDFRIYHFLLLGNIWLLNITQKFSLLKIFKIFH